MSGFSWHDLQRSMRAARKDGDAQRMLNDEGVRPEVGGVYTVSPDFTCGDRSFTHHFLRVLSRSGPNLLVEMIGDHPWKTQPFLISESNQYWYPADDAFATYRAALKETSDGVI